MIELSDDQKAGMLQVVSRDDMEMTIAGYAGTGKTQLCSEIARFLNCNEGNRKHYGEVVMLAPTWKAARVLSAKSGVTASTVHSRMYRGASIDSNGIMSFSVPKLTQAFYIVDEASMIGDRLYNDFMGQVVMSNSRVLWCGDPGQLPPVGERRSPVPLDKPTVLLRQSIRQGENSEIFHFANNIRSYGLRKLSYHQGEKVSVCKNEDNIHGYDGIICSTNAMRVGYNKRYIVRDIESYPLKRGDKLIFQENKGGVFNGETLDVDHCRKTTKGYDVKLPEGSWCSVLNAFGEKTVSEALSFLKVKREKSRRGVIAFYGWAMTCHKAQGSEFDNVLVEFRDADWLGIDKVKWLYTAITRAKKKVKVLV